MVTNDTPEEKRLEHTAFVLHATRGLIRDQKTRRRVMIVVIIAVLLMVSGSTIFQAVLDPHEHPGWFILFWLVCAWLTVTAILMAVFDLLMLRSRSHEQERRLRSEFEKRSTQSRID